MATRRTLTAKQQTFVAEYLVDLNATQAGIRAGYSAGNADKIASELLGKTRVAAAVQQAMAERQQRAEVTQDEVISKLREHRDGAAAAGQYAPAIRADELLGKHVGMFRDRLQVEGTVTHDLGGNLV